MPTTPAGLFDRATAIPVLRRDYLAGITRAYAAGVAFHDDFLWAKLLAAEAELERKLRVFFCPVTIIPQGATDIVPEPGERWVEEPGYDYTPSLFMGDSWGLMETRHRPIISVGRMWFAYPSLGSGSVWTVPLPWMRIEKKYGRINLVPTAHTMSMPLNAYLLSVIGGGRTVPLMLQIHYRAGLTDAATQYPELMDLIQMRAAFSVLESLFYPASGSISADGLSQSMSVDAAKYRDALDAKTEALRTAIHGVRMMVL
jgi:hypothetical protein